MQISAIQGFYLNLLSGISCVMYFYAAYQRIPKRIYWYIFFLVAPIAFGISMNQSVVMVVIKPLVLSFVLCTLIIVADLFITWIKNFRRHITGVNVAASGVFLFFLVAAITVGSKILGLDTTTPEFLTLASQFYLPVSFVISIMQITRAYYQEKEKSQLEVIGLTQQNNEILQNQNLYLEKEVAQRTMELQAEKKNVETRNTEILDSIEYAKRIQNTILPPQTLMAQYLPESFVLYLPKDIVAGDFYWVHKIQPTDGVLVAACDCTGHGVPGAMVSVVCSNAMNKAVNELKLSRPSEILNATREEVIQALSRNNLHDDEVKDGMDASLALIHFSQRKLYWSGANNPIWISRAGDVIEL
ncbi:MAG: PP2C family protein-serine/threonine phosphatase, partial [Flavobacteriales bacterium]